VQYLIRRVLLLFPTVLLVTTAVFVLVRLVPGDAVSLLIADQNVSTEAAERLRADLGLDRPLAAQYGAYLGDLLRGDLGRSIWTGQSVAQELGRRAPVTLELTLLAAVFSVLYGVAGGVRAALSKDRWPDYLLRGVSIAGLSLPGFWLGTLAIVLPALWWRYTPPLRYVPFFTDPLTNLRQFLVPAVIMGLAFGSVLLRMTRALMLEVLGDDYVRTARAKGLPERRVIAGHALRNALIPVVTVFGTQLAVLIGGTVVFEQIFNLKGIGSYTFEAVTRRDYPAIQSVNVVLATVVVLLNVLVDLSYVLLDPRTRGRST
jgi:peptide/nickel transport system permease protein